MGIKRCNNVLTVNGTKRVFELLDEINARLSEVHEKTAKLHGRLNEYSTGGERENAEGVDSRSPLTITGKK